MSIANKLKKYTCTYCGNKYQMYSHDYAKRCLGFKKKCCTNEECEDKAIDKVIQKLKQQKKRDWKKRKEQMKNEVGIKKKQHQEPLQKSINKIARLLDYDLPCLARPTERHVRFDAGHIYSVGSHPALRYNLWNIHKQSVKSNRDLGGEQGLMLEGIEIRYGQETRAIIESLPNKYKTIKLTSNERRDALKIANQLIRDLEKGEKYTRDQVNKKIGIYEN